jgi:hypothetical protein
MRFTYRMSCLSQWHHPVDCLLRHLQSGRGGVEGNGGLLIAIIVGVLVDNTITKANKHFDQYRDNAAKSTHGLYEMFCLE